MELLQQAIFFLATLCGVLAGIFTGIMPGLHINLVAAIVSTLSFSAFNTVAVAAFIMAMSISHVFHDFLPSIFLGVSNSEAVLAAMPGHRLLLKGQGRKAIMLAACGALTGILALVAITPVMIVAVRIAFIHAKNHIWQVLVVAVIIQLIKSGTIRAAAANLVIFLVSGAFGLAVFSVPSLGQPLLPMLSGLFGASSILSGLMRKPIIPPQQSASGIKIINKARIVKYVAAGLFSSSLIGLFPAMGPAQAAMIGTSIFRKLRSEAYLFLLGLISSASMLFALLTLYAFGKSRNGSIAVLGNIMGFTSNFPKQDLVALLLVAVISAALSCASAVTISRLFALAVRKVNYSLMSALTIVLVICLVAAFSGPIGLPVLAVATAIGLLPLLMKSSRQALMGCLILPVLGYYLN